MKRILPILAVLFSSLYTYSQTVANPFTKYGYYVLTATSSHGEFEEFHDTKDVVEIGTLLYNTKTKQIVGFVDEEEISVMPAVTAMSIDPHCERYYWISPYAYCMNNPIRFVDPNGMDVYRYDDKTGEMVLAVQNDDKFDQIGKFKYDKKTGEYNLQTKKDGTAKTRMDNIEKGILSDGINFKENDNVIAVGGEGQATVEGVRDFVVGLSEMVDKEIGGYEYSLKGEANASNVYLNKYANNTPKNAYGGYNPRVSGLLPSQITVHTHFHTHLSRFPSLDKFNPSAADISTKNIQQKNGVKKFIILTQGYSPIQY